MLASIDPASRIGVRDRAVLLLGYAAAPRPGEIAVLHRADVSAGRDGLLVTIRRSKTDQEGLCQLVGVGALRAWLGLRPVGPGPLFTRVPGTRPITREGIGQRTVSDLVCNRAVAAGLGVLGVCGHSLRAGQRHQPRPRTVPARRASGVAE